MDRREVLALTATLVGGTIIGGPFWLTGCAAPGKLTVPLGSNDLLFLDEIGETILPKTDRSPGAKEARIGAFMKTIVTDCYSLVEQQLFMAGMDKIKERSALKFGKTFMKLSAGEKFQMLAEIDAEAAEQSRAIPPTLHYFTLMKQLTIWGYFSSEPGCTQALRYNPVPGRYEGCVPYEPGTAAWY